MGPVRPLLQPSHEAHNTEAGGKEWEGGREGHGRNAISILRDLYIAEANKERVADDLEIAIHVYLGGFKRQDIAVKLWLTGKQSRNVKIEPEEKLVHAGGEHE